MVSCLSRGRRGIVIILSRFSYISELRPQIFKAAFTSFMISILAGALVISFLHALIPNHWLPVIAIGRRENWSTPEVTRITLLCGLAHGISTALLGLILSFLGGTLDSNISFFATVAAPVILIIIGLVFIYRHHVHKHFHLDESVKKKHSKKTIITALVIAMFFSPCLEIEAYFLLAGAYGWSLSLFIAVVYIVISTAGMVLLVTNAYRGLIRLNWHSLEHNAGIITGVTLVATGIISFFIN